MITLLFTEQSHEHVLTKFIRHPLFYFQRSLDFERFFIKKKECSDFVFATMKTETDITWKKSTLADRLNVPD